MHVLQPGQSNTKDFSGIVSMIGHCRRSATSEYDVLVVVWCCVESKCETNYVCGSGFENNEAVPFRLTRNLCDARGPFFGRAVH